MKEGDRLVYFRYTTIILGFDARHFILNFVKKHHANKLPDDSYTKMLKKHFYADSLIRTGYSIDNLSKLQILVNDRMPQVNFNLRLWNTNCERLKSKMINDQNFVEYGCRLENVLGYKYSLLEDTLQNYGFSIEHTVNIKRGILSKTARVFDPMFLCLPVTIT